MDDTRHRHAPSRGVRSGNPSLGYDRPAILYLSRLCLCRGAPWVRSGLKKVRCEAGENREGEARRQEGLTRLKWLWAIIPAACWALLVVTSRGFLFHGDYVSEATNACDYFTGTGTVTVYEVGKHSRCPFPLYALGSIPPCRHFGKPLTQTCGEPKAWRHPTAQR